MSFLFFLLLFFFFFLLEAPYFNIGDNSFWWKFEARGSMTVVLQNKICNKMEQLICAYHFTYWFRQCNVKHLQIWGCHGTEYWDSFWNVTFFLHLEAALKMKAASTGTVVPFCQITVSHSRRLNLSMQKCSVERTISKSCALGFHAMFGIVPNLTDIFN